MLRMRYTTCIRCIKYLPGPEPTSMLWHEHDRIFFQVTSQICREASSHGNTLFGFNQMHQRWPCQRRLLGWALIDTGLGETMSLYVKQITQLYGDFSYFQLKYICFGDVFNKSPTIGTSIPTPVIRPKQEPSGDGLCRTHLWYETADAFPLDSHRYCGYLWLNITS